MAEITVTLRASGDIACPTSIDSGGQGEIDPNTLGYHLTVQDEGTSIDTDVRLLNFTGNLVTATQTVNQQARVNVQIPNGTYGDIVVSSSGTNWTITGYDGETSIVTLGTITTGAWNATTIATTYGGTGLTSYTTGDMLYASSTNVLSQLPVGNSNQVLTVASGLPTWKYPFIPINQQNADYTAALTDGGGCIYRSSADSTARTWTIPANASVAYPVGTTLSFINNGSANSCSIAITSDTLVLAGTGTTGTRTLARYGQATATKVEATVWYIIGTGLT